MLRHLMNVLYLETGWLHDVSRRILGIEPEGSTGVRLVLDEDGSGLEHNVLIEREPTCWRFIFHNSAGDALCIVEYATGQLRIVDDLCERPDVVYDLDSDRKVN